MLFSSPVFAKASGSINGMTFSHNRGGQYVRCRNVPTNPSTCRQQAVRSDFSQLSTHWNNGLTQSQRDAWIDYADNVTVTNKIGNETNLSGFNWFLGNNVPRLQNSLSIQETAPTIFNRGTAPDMSLDTAIAGSSTTFNIDSSGDWAAGPTSFLMVYQSRPQDLSVKFLPPEYRFVASLAGDNISPPTTIAVTDAELAWPNVINQRYNMKFRAILTDGRYTPETIVCVDDISI